MTARETFWRCSLVCGAIILTLCLLGYGMAALPFCVVGAACCVGYLASLDDDDAS